MDSGWSQKFEYLSRRFLYTYTTEIAYAECIRLCTLDNPLQEAQNRLVVIRKHSDTCLSINSFLSWPQDDKIDIIKG